MNIAPHNHRSHQYYSAHPDSNAIAYTSVEDFSCGRQYRWEIIAAVGSTKSMITRSAHAYHGHIGNDAHQIKGPYRNK